MFDFDADWVAVLLGHELETMHACDIGESDLPGVAWVRIVHLLQVDEKSLHLDGDRHRNASGLHQCLKHFFGRRALRFRCW